MVYNRSLCRFWRWTPLYRPAVALLLVAGFLWSSQSGGAETGLILEVPIDCTPGQDCFIQNYVDTDPGPGALDYTCGFLSYDSHKGVDFRLPDLTAMEHGVAVLAAADGKVRAVRNTMQDVNVRVIGREALKGHEAGNAVAVRHADGWETQYSHLRRGSVRVRPGQRVRAGDVLGMVGLSGLTEFPHLHFGVRHHGARVDPFTGLNPGSGCGPGEGSLWSPGARQALTYLPTGVLGSGFDREIPTMAGTQDGRHHARKLGADAPLIAFWVSVFGVEKDDRLYMRILDRDGGSLVEKTRVLPKTQAQRFAYIGKRRPREGWPAGEYTGEYTLSRQRGDRREVIFQGRQRLSVTGDG